MLSMVLGIQGLAVNVLWWRQARHKDRSEIYRRSGAEDDEGEKRSPNEGLAEGAPQ